MIKLSRGRSVGPCVGLSSTLWKNGGIIGRTGPGTRHVLAFGDRSTGRGTFGGEFGARHCVINGTYGIRVRQCRDAAFFPNYFGQTCCMCHVCVRLTGKWSDASSHSCWHWWMDWSREHTLWSWPQPTGLIASTLHSEDLVSTLHCCCVVIKRVFDVDASVDQCCFVCCCVC